MRSMKHALHAAAGLAIIAVSIAIWGVSRPAALEGNNRERVLNAYANLPLAFVENRGQADSRVRFYGQGPRYNSQRFERSVCTVMTKDCPLGLWDSEAC